MFDSTYPLTHPTSSRPLTDDDDTNTHIDKQAFMALFATPDDDEDHRGLRGSKKAGNGGGGSAVDSTTVLLDGLAMGAIFGYFTTLKFPGNQVGGLWFGLSRVRVLRRGDGANSGLVKYGRGRQTPPNPPN
jgi:hypothetical protein